jgi:D-proline reductase (dithiol) PrdB
MASYDELIPKYQQFMLAYPFARFANATVPSQKLYMPLNAARIALITTAGLHTAEQRPFDKTIKGGDCSFREISNEAEIHSLIESQKSDAFDHSGLQQDVNLAFPLDRFRELLENGQIGALNQRHFSFMGSITDPAILISKSIPQAVKQLDSDGVDIAFLTPV